MRGNKFLLKIGSIIAVLVLSVATSFLFRKNVGNVQAEDSSLFNRSYASQEYDDGVIFSAEQVYFNKTESGNPLYYKNDGTKPLSNILGYSGNNYFANFNSDFNQSSFVSENDSKGKKIIYPGDFAMIDDITPMTAYKTDGNAVSLSQGIMMTLGGYIYEDGTMYTNGHTNGVGADGKPIYDKMSKLTYVGISIYRNGEKITDTESSSISLRTYNSGLYFDFVYFLEASKQNEGYYQIDLSYTLEGQSNVSHSFDFYMLLKTSYTSPEEVNGLSYTTYPTFSNTTLIGNKHYQFINNDQMPVLTYDYRHYDLEYAYKVNDLVTSVKVEYERVVNQGINRLKFTSTTNGVSSVRYYDLVLNNTIVSLLFSNIGTYQFNFKYVYNYTGNRLVVDNLSIDTMQLDIHGYEIKYAKYGFNASTFRKLTIAQNGVVVVPVNGYTEAEASVLKDIDLSYIYELDENSSNKSGVVEKTESPNTSIEFDAENKKFTMLPDFVNTDQGGVWLELNDKYQLTGSYYLYSSTPFTTEKEYSSSNFQKDTTFTKLGYYYVCVNYKCDSIGDAQTQYFAFRISSSTPNVTLRTTTALTLADKDNSADGRIYSNQFTNKNVYAQWKNAGTFESKQVAYLYYANKSANPYQSKESLLNYARGGSNAVLTRELFDKENRLLQDSGSYLLEMQVVSSQTRVYYYFVIDKEDISGIETLGVSSAYIGNNTVYSVATDENNRPIKYTSSFAINQNFTMWWNDKPSGARITGSYKFAPFVYDKQTDEMQIVTKDGIEYRYLKTNYKLGTVSFSMSIEKPATQYAVVNSDNVLTKQGIYWFELVDEAGNQMNYMVVVDNTEAKIIATTSSGVQLANGSTSSEDVTLEWGTHKLISLGIEKNGTNLESIYAKFGKTLTNKYYKGETSNFDTIERVLVDDGGSTVDFAIKLEKAIVNSMGNSLTLNSDGTSSISGGDWQGRYAISNGYSIVLKPVMREWAYTLKVFGENQKYSLDSTSFFTLVLNKDKSEGKVKSKGNEADDFTTKVFAYNDEFSETNLKNNYLDGQASDDGLFVFEWLSGEGTETEVKEVYYEYYPLMTQEELNRFDKNNADFDFYPYSKTSTKHYIFGGDNNAQNYNLVDIDGKTFYRSHYLNVGYVSYYENNVIVSKNATKPGMYVVTRVYKAEVQEDATIRSYVFFVDRNNIIDYSTTGNSSQKTVGSFIDFLMQDVLSFDSFTEKVAEISYNKNTYSIYLQSNKLPLSIRIPTGKYASQVDGQIVRTSNSNSGGLKFEITFIDTQNYLGNGNNAGFTLFKMTDMQKSGGYYVTDGYISYLLNTSSLYMGEGNINGGNINRYLTACNKKGAEYLSLPGIYIIEIYDNVGKIQKADNINEMEDRNSLTIGIEITQQLPSVDAYAGKNDDGVVTGTDRIETVLVNGEKFNTNKTFVMYELPQVDETQNNAQIDDGYIYITRRDVETDQEEIYYNSVTNSGVVNMSTKLNDTERNVIDKSVDDKTIVWLDTGIKFDDNKVVEYKEYIYTIRVRYVLYKNDTGYYTYNYVSSNNANDIESIASFYEASYQVNIDRTPILDNLQNAVNGNSVLLSQREFLAQYLQYILEENNVEYTESGKLYNGTNLETIFNTISYRDNNGEINFAVVNKIYYYLLENDNVNADFANYAIRVNQNMSVDLSQGTMYVREITNNNLATLIPITAKYNETGYDKFDKNELTNGFRIVGASSNANWSNVLTKDGLYEVVEIDDCGNFTQYIVMYCNDTDASKYNSQLSFEDVLMEDESRIKYGLTITFAQMTGSRLEFVPSLTITRNGNAFTTNSFALTGLWSVEDIFGNRSATGENAINTNNASDTYYKITLKSQTDEKVFYSNFHDYDIAKFLFDNIMKDQNYVITITDRFNNSLSFDLNINENIYDMELNVDAFVVTKESVGESSQYMLVPSTLNSKPSATFTFYAKTIELRDDTNKKTVVYTLNSNGQIVSFVDNSITYTYDGTAFVPDDESKQNKDLPTTKIVLETGHYYTAFITDMVNKTYTVDNLFAGDNTVASVSFEWASPHTDYNNEYYTTDCVTVNYDVNAFDSIRVRIYQDGTPIEDGLLSDTGLGNFISASTTVDTRKSFVLKPYEQSKIIAKTGASLQYVISFMNNGVKKKESTIYIDNRVASVSIISEKGEDKANIVRVDYESFGPEDAEQDKLRADTMFKYTPTLSLSETVVFSWEDINNCKYIANSFTYFNTKLFLYSFDSKDDYTRRELSSLEDMFVWISPKENSIGRYVFVYAICNNNGQCMMYKAFSFNISSTANAMYEVKDENGNVMEYNGVTKGSTIKEIVTNWIGLKNSFGLLETLPENPSDTDKNNNAKFTKFINQNIPVYISNSVLNVVPNGDNGVTSKLYTEKLTDYYTLNLYQVFNEVHTTYVIILSVSKTSSLASFTSIDDSPLRYVGENSRVSLNTSVVSVDELGTMYFPSFFVGNMTSTSKAEPLLRINELYLEVYYKLSETDKKYVGKIFGNYAVDDNGNVVSTTKFVQFKSAGAYQIYLRDIAGNTHTWGNESGDNTDSLTLNVVNEVLVSVNGNAPIDYAYYNGEVTVAVSFNNLYENASTTIKAYRNGSQNEYITTEGGRKTNYLSSFTFTEYGTYSVEVSAKRKNVGDIKKVLVFSIINGDEARLALDFTSISKYTIDKVTNYTTGSDVSDIFRFLLNEGYIYSKLITYDRLSAENAFGSTMGKQTFEVEYTVNNDPLLPARSESFRFTINNQTPSLQCSLQAGESTTKQITLTLNPQTIYRQVGDCYIMVNDTVVLTINGQTAHDRTMTLTLEDVGVYYVRIMSDSGRVISSFQVTIKEPLNAWSIVLIVAVVLLVVGVITVFIILRTKMRVR